MTEYFDAELKIFCDQLTIPGAELSLQQFGRLFIHFDYFFIRQFSVKYSCE